MGGHRHFSVVRERLTQNSLNVAEWTGALTWNVAAQRASPDDARMQALAPFLFIIRHEATVMAYSACFFPIGVALLRGVSVLFLIPKPQQAGAAAAH